MDYSILIYAPKKLQLERPVEQRNLTKAYALKILAAQMPIDKKKHSVDYVVDNTGTIPDLHRCLREVLKRLL
jgi:dephospho-CoA kinase